MKAMDRTVRWIVRTWGLVIHVVGFDDICGPDVRAVALDGSMFFFFFFRLIDQKMRECEFIS